ncbi:hypothetical protein EDC01DRAFT_684630 [Geopyxis carbonaria]|nr:hypothetical protein EDC01DRAFT_684630 [Geopyxis carbonaria]
MTVPYPPASSSSPAVDSDVCIVGAGPVGLFLAILLLQSAPTKKIAIFDAAPGILQTPRAVVYHPVVLHEFAAAGLLPSLLAAGERNDAGVFWRAPGGRVLAHLETPPPNTQQPDAPNFTLLLGQPVLARILLDRLLAHPESVDVTFACAFEGLTQHPDSDFVTVQLAGGRTHTTRRLVGCDGGRSGVRRALGMELEGFTWTDLRFAAADVRHTTIGQHWGPANFVCDAEDWAVVIKIGKGDLWRVATELPDDVDADDRPVLEQALREKYKRILPAVPGMADFEFTNLAPFNMHQRCVPEFVRGRVALAGDAAHLNNPVGALGLTTGLLDAAALARALCAGPADEKAALERYARERKDVFVNVTNPASIANRRRLLGKTKESVAEREAFFGLLRKGGDARKEVWRRDRSLMWSLSSTA